MIPLRLLLLLAIGALFSACAVVTGTAESTTVEHRTTFVLGMAAAGLALIVLGLYLVPRVLRPRLRRYRGRPIRQIRTFVAFLAIPALGVMLLILVLPFWRYRVEVRRDALVMDTFPGGHRELRKEDIQRLDRIEGGTRILVRSTSGEVFFINGGELGQEAVDRLWEALHRSTLRSTGRDPDPR